MISVVAKIPLKEGKAQEIMESVKTLMAGVAKEEGTLFYTVSADRKAPDTLVFMERYADKAAFKAPSETPHFNEFMGKVMGVLEGAPEISVLNEILSAK